MSDPRPRTHLGIDPRLCGRPVSMADGEATVELETIPEMAADDRGLVHGGFVFGLADYAAMLAVDDPLVVLGAAQTRFLAPVRVGDRLLARAHTVADAGRKRSVEVEVARGGETIMTGTFTCFVLDRHVLERE